MQQVFAPISPDAMRGRVAEAVAWIRERSSFEGGAALVCGTGLGALDQVLESVVAFSYAEIPHFPRSTVASHHGAFITGMLSGRSFCVLQGRFHLYEGYLPQEVIFPIRVLHALGCRELVLTNAAGGVDADVEVGDLVLLEDQVNGMFANPLVGANDSALGPRFPDMSQPFSARLAGYAREAAREAGVALKAGTYLGLPGPSLETPAEYRLAQRWGASVVGMSTVPEVLAARHLDMEVAGISTVTNVWRADACCASSHAAHVAAADASSRRLMQILAGLAARL